MYVQQWRWDTFNAAGSASTTALHCRGIPTTTRVLPSFPRQPCPGEMVIALCPQLDYAYPTAHLPRKFLFRLESWSLSNPDCPIAAALQRGKLMIAATPEAARWHSGWEPLPPTAISLQLCQAKSKKQSGSSLVVRARIDSPHPCPRHFFLRRHDDPYKIAPSSVIACLCLSS